MHYGVQVGMRRRHAQGLCPDLEIAAYQPDRDRRAFNTVVRTINEIVPLIEVSEPGVIVFATRGPSRYFGGDEPMANKIVKALRTSIAADSQFGVGLPTVVWRPTLLLTSRHKTRPKPRSSLSQKRQKFGWHKNLSEF